MNPTQTKEQLEGIIFEVEDSTEKYSMQTRALLRALIAARRICEKMMIEEAILQKQGKAYFEANQPIEKKPIQIDNIKKPKK
jgi:hypothetical protein